MAAETGEYEQEIDRQVSTFVDSKSVYNVVLMICFCAGSGKTGAFCLPIVQTVWETLRDIRDGKKTSTGGGGGGTGAAATSELVRVINVSAVVI
jgi:hypothetical protein